MGFEKQVNGPALVGYDLGSYLAESELDKIRWTFHCTGEKTLGKITDLWRSHGTGAIADKVGRVLYCRHQLWCKQGKRCKIPTDTKPSLWTSTPLPISEKNLEMRYSVIWRPLQRSCGGWFWWGAKGPQPCKVLWRLCSTGLVNHHGLNNLICFGQPIVFCLSCWLVSGRWICGCLEMDIYPAKINMVRSTFHSISPKEISEAGNLLRSASVALCPILPWCLNTAICGRGSWFGVATIHARFAQWCNMVAKFF